MSKIALGRGLGSLIPQKPGIKNLYENKTALEENKGLNDKRVIDVDIEKISKNPLQMRKNFSKEALAELAESIKIHGILQPLVVTEQKHPTGADYQLITGERRLWAAKIAGLKKVPAIIRSAAGREKLELALVENIQRENLNPVEEAEAYKKMQSEFNLTQEEVAKRSGKSRSRVANFLRLLSLPLEIQRAISENKISEGHGRAILALRNPEKQRALFKEILSRNLTVRQAEEKIKLISVSGHVRKIVKKNNVFRETEEALSEFLGSKVEIKKYGKETKIIIDCYSQEEFNNVVAAILKK